MHNVMKSNRNPFRYGAAFELDDIVGRKDEITRAEHAIRDGQRLFLIGPRGFGKTSILRAAQANMSREGAIVLYVNAETNPNIRKIVGEIVAGVAARVYEGAEDGIQKAGRFFSHLEPTFRFSAVDQEVLVSIGVELSDGKYRQMDVLADTLNSLNRLAQTLPDSRPLTLMIDEFSALMARFGVIAEGQIRAVVQRHRNVGYIFAGSNVGLMTDMTAKHSRPFYHGGDNLFLRPVPPADFTAWIHKEFAESGFEVAGGAPVLRIRSLAEDVPYNVQMLAHNCWDELRSGNRLELTVDLVETVFERTVQSFSHSFTETWDRLTPLQQRTLIAVLHGDGQRFRPAEIARFIGSPASSVHSALRALYRRNIFWDDWNLMTVRVRMEDPFFGHWIRVRMMDVNLAIR